MTTPFTITYGTLVAIAAAILISALNYIGIRKAGDFQLVFTLLKVGIVLAVVGVAFHFSGGSWQHFSTRYDRALGGLGGFMVALVAALWAYDGWNDLNMVAEEIRRPERSIPIALIAGVATVAALYMLLNAAVQYVMPATMVAASPRPASTATALAVGRWGAGLVSAGMALSMLVTLNGTVMSGARVPYAVARDGYFFQELARVHPRFHTPSSALIVQAVLSILLLLSAGSFQQLFSLAIFAEWLFYMIASSTVFVFRRREPNAPRAYKTWGYPVVPTLFILASAFLLYYTFTENLKYSGIGLLVILAGIPVFLFFQRRTSSQRV